MIKFSWTTLPVLSTLHKAVVHTGKLSQWLLGINDPLLLDSAESVCERETFKSSPLQLALKWKGPGLAVHVLGSIIRGSSLNRQPLHL